MSVSSAKRGVAAHVERPPPHKAKIETSFSLLYSLVQQNSQTPLNTKVSILKEDGEDMPREQKFVQIAHRVYEVVLMALTPVAKKQLPRHPIILDASQYQDCKESVVLQGEESFFQMVPFDPSGLPKWKAIEFELVCSSSNLTQELIVLEEPSLQAIFNSLNGQVLMTHQHLRLPLSHGTIIAKVKATGNLSSHTKVWHPARMGGLVCETTRFTFSTPAGSGITFLEAIHETHEEILRFKVTSERTSSTTSLLVDVEVLKSVLNRQGVLIGGEKIAVGADFPSIYLSLDMPPGQTFYQQGYKITKQTIIQFNPTSDILLVDCKKLAVNAIKIFFKIEHFVPKKESSELIDAEDLAISILHLKKNWILDEKIWVRTMEGDCLIKVEKVAKKLSLDETSTEMAVDGEENISVRYRVDQDTKIEFACDSRFKLGEFSKILSASKVVLKVNRPPMASGGLFGLFEERSKEITRFPEKELKELARQQIGIFTKDESVETTFFYAGKATNVNFTIVDFNAKVEKEQKSSYTALIQLAPDAEIEFKQADTPEIVIEKEVGEMREPALEDCLKLGIGGLSEEIQELYLHLIASRKSRVKERFEICGMPPCKGVLLYGPPGTGKTLLAKNMAKLLGCDDSRVRHISAAEVLNKWLGNSEKNVKRLFAREKGDKSLLIVIIDEADALLGKRASGSNDARNSVVNQFLKEMDGATSNSDTIVILLTNLKDRLDEAVLRPGRCGLHFHIDLPNFEQRKEIFEVYLRKLREVNLLHADVNLPELASKTDGFSGAFIADMVRQANLFAVGREMKRKDQEGKSVERVTMQDLLKALENLKVQEQSSKLASNSTIYN